MQCNPDFQVHPLKCISFFKDHLLFLFFFINLYFAVVSFPRVKSFSFEKMGFTMEIPRVLAIGNVAVRVMYTRYDHLSPLSKSFHPRIKVKPPEVVVEEAPPAEETDPDGVVFSVRPSTST